MKRLLTVLAGAALSGCSPVPGASSASDPSFEGQLRHINRLLQAPERRGPGQQTHVFTPSGPCQARLEITAVGSKAWSPKLARMTALADINFAWGMPTVQYVPAYIVRLRDGGAEHWGARIQVRFNGNIQFGTTEVSSRGSVLARSHKTRELGIAMPNDMAPELAAPVIAAFQAIGALCGSKDNDGFLEMPERPLEEVVRLAGQGDPAAVGNLCHRYKEGSGGAARDDALALSWCQKGADAGVGDAATMLGELYFYGQGVARDDARALRLFEEEEKSHRDQALYMLFRMYAEGRGVTRDEQKAMAYLRRAAEAGHKLARAELKKRGS
ncbi:sel1 repeat family protein [Massilia sp. PAMC28688]|uniref:tetratricopeptide repeat protein n=1 Tax=Massilia sp. PAMC28688 TaxID=2861283 RepID=UPI001C6248B6|nr:tetratricopeptide repeat protein [Massilia sp. PAMC28688]QYF93952.1 sel1 repeat family protein [Massilia sp. PAMC28688]